MSSGEDDDPLVETFDVPATGQLSMSAPGDILAKNKI
jgi:hypothetical protein